MDGERGNTICALLDARRQDRGTPDPEGYSRPAPRHVIANDRLTIARLLGATFLIALIMLFVPFVFSDEYAFAWAIITALAAATVGVLARGESGALAGALVGAAVWSVGIGLVSFAKIIFQIVSGYFLA